LKRDIDRLNFKTTATYVSI